jgi:hypothetical protein
MKIANRLGINTMDVDTLNLSSKKRKKGLNRRLSSFKLSKAFRQSTLSQRSRAMLMLNTEETQKLKVNH